MIQRASPLVLSILIFLVTSFAYAQSLPDLTPKQSPYGYTYILVDPVDIMKNWELVAENTEYYPFLEYYYSNSNDWSSDKVELASIIFYANGQLIGYGVYYHGKTYFFANNGTNEFVNMELTQDNRTEWQKDWNRFCFKDKKNV